MRNPGAIKSAMNVGSGVFASYGRLPQNPDCPVGYHVHNWFTLGVMFTVRLVNGAPMPGGVL